MAGGWKRFLKVKSRKRAVAKAASAYSGYAGLSANYSADQYKTPDQVRYIQQYLNTQGFGLAVDGIMGPRTRAALAAAQGRTATAQRASLDYVTRGGSQLAAQESAAAARKRVAALAAKIAKETGDRQVAATLKELQAAPDAAISDVETIVNDYYRKLQSAKAKADKSKKKGGFWHNIKKGMEWTPIGVGLKVASTPAEEVQQIYYSSKRTQLRGGSTGAQVRSALGAVPGLGFTASGRTRKDIEDVNSLAERAALTKKGELASFGEVLSGRAYGKLKGKALEQYKKTGAHRLPGITSPALDLGFQVATDPWSYTAAVARPFARVGEVLSPAQRLAYLDKSKVGRELLDEAASAIGKAQDVKSLRKSITGLSTHDAQEVLRLARTEGKAAAAARLRQAFVDGTWNPSVSIRRQLAVKATGRGLGVKGVRGLGAPVIRTSDSLAKLRAVARKAAPRATLTTARASVALNHAVEAALSRAEMFAPDFHREFIAEKVAGLTTDDRFARVWELADSQDVAAFRDVVAARYNDIASAIQQAKTRPLTTAERTQLMEAAETTLQQLEAAAEILHGAAGREAQQQAAVELAQGLKFKPRSEKRLVQEAARNIGLDLPGKLRKGELERLLDNNPELAAEAARLDVDEATRLTQGEVPVERAGLGLRSTVRGPANLVLSIAESVAPNRVAFQGAENPLVALNKRVEAVDRWVTDLGSDDFVRSQIRRSAEDVKSEDELYGLIRGVLRREAQKAGIDPKVLVRMLNEGRAAARAGRATLVDENGELISDLQTVAQRSEDAFLPDPADVRATIRDEQARLGTLSISGRARRGATKVANIPTGLHRATGESVSVADAAMSVHRTWKFVIVTNLWAPGIGALAGFVGEDGGWGDKFKAAGLGAAIGAAGPARYIMRVAGIEENLRFYMARGFKPPEWIPVVSKWARKRGVDDLTFMSHDSVRASSFASREHLSNPLAAVAPGWKRLARKEGRYVDAWFRVLNHQIHAETDPLARIFLQAKAGQLDPAEAVSLAKNFLRTTDEGKLLMRRLKGGFKGPKTIDEALARYQNFVEVNVPSPWLAEQRLEGQVSHEILQTLNKQKLSPEFVHAQESWVFPKNFQQLAETRDHITRSLVFEGPTSRFNRERLAEHIYQDEYKRLVKDGVEPKTAQQVADEYAVERTNEIMFQVNDESRFAKKVDFVFPFQQPREELVRVWGKLALQGPARTLRLGRLAALAFNNGEEQGTFRKDPFTGQWELTIPGSTFIANHLLNTHVGFDADLKGLLFFGQGAYGLNVIPSLGGPWWTVASRSFINSNPEVYENLHPVAKKLMFPYGSSGFLMRAEARRLWMGIAGTRPPWEFAAGFEAENELNRWTKEIYLQLRYQHFQETGDADWEPTPQEVQQATKDFFKVWSFIGSVFPAAPHPVFPSQQDFQSARQMYVDPVTNELDFSRFVTENPQFAPFMNSRTEWVGPDDYKHWTDRNEKGFENYTLHYKKHLSIDEFRANLKEARDKSIAWKDFYNRLDNPDPYQRENALIEWREAHPELAKEQRNKYLAALDLTKIMTGYPKGETQDQALDRWRKQYDMTPGEYQGLRKKIREGKMEYSPWRSARDTEDVVAAVEKQMRRGIADTTYVATLAPAEQVRYWNYRIGQLTYEGGSPKDVLDKYSNLKTQVRNLFNEYPFLRSQKKKSQFEEAIQKWRGDTAQATSSVYAEINRMKPAMDAAVKAKDWRTYYALKAKRDSLYDMVKELKNKAYKEHPDLLAMQQELQGVMTFFRTGNKRVLSSMFDNLQEGVFVPSNEAQWFLGMPEPVKAAHVDNMIDRLLQEEKWDQATQTSKLYWSYLTDFQRDLVEANLPEELLNDIKRQQPEKSGFKSYGKGSGYRRYGRRGFSFGGLGLGEGGGELAFATEMFRQYTQRAPGSKPPAAYEAYRALPNNPAVRSEFLKAHPEVAAWIKTGPFANMPPLVRMMVANIMVKYGKWEGEEKDIHELTDLAFAREQLERWNKRTGERPSTYDIWLNMPTGVEKANYIKAHPEIQDWIRLGPMSNMPDEYREVVRDIMQRYGEWTERQDPLGQVISQFYATPSYARQAFLQQHPELVEYWAATRSPEENRLHNLAEQYFAMASPQARRLFLASNPDLQGHFLTQRTKRYEKFLNKVAQFMGSNPELFEQYLKRQEDILGEILNRFGTPNMVREVGRISAEVPRSRTSEGGRQRRAA